MERQKLAVRYGLGAGAVLLLWVAGAYGIAPRLIRSAYAEESIGVLNRLLDGRSTTPVTRYLDAWSGWAGRATVGLVLLLILGGVVAVFRSHLLRLRARLFQAEPAIGGATAVLAAISIGLTLGAVEVGVRALKYHFDGVFFEWSNPDALWMIPTSQAALFGVLALAYVVVLGRPAPRVSLKPLLTVLFGLGGWGILASMKQLGIHPLAGAVLALGLGFQAAEAVGRQPARSLRQLRATAALTGAFALGAVVWLHPVQRFKERARVSALPAASGRGLPNVLLLVLDTVRAQNLSLYGYPRPTTPTLDRLARQGVVFDRAIATAPWTLPSHAALFTGRWHHELSSDWLQPLDARFPTLAEFLSGQGYQTGGFVANLLYTTRITGLNRGFHVYRDHQVDWQTWLYSSAVVQRVVDRVRPLVPGGYALFDRKTAADVNGEFLQWMDGLQGRRFFGFLNYFDAHEPYERFQPQFAQVRTLPRDSVEIGPGQQRALEQWERERVDRYDGSIRYMDTQIDALLRELETRGVLDNTLVLITADHGDQFFEHGLEGHSNSLYQMLTHVPLLAVLPGTVPTAIRVQETVSIRDVPTTIADLLDLSGPAPFAGSSLRGTWQPASDWGVANAALSEVNPYPLEDFDGPVVRGPMKAVTVGNLHYIRYGDGIEELYDLDVDPGEVRDLVADGRGAAQLPALRQALREAAGIGSFRRSEVPDEAASAVPQREPPAPES